MKISEDDLKVLNDLLDQANQEAVGAEAKAAWCRARGELGAAQDQDAMAAMYGDQARALCNALAVLDGTGDVDPQVRPAAPDARPRLTLIKSEKTA